MEKAPHVSRSKNLADHIFTNRTENDMRLYTLKASPSEVLSPARLDLLRFYNIL